MNKVLRMCLVCFFALSSNLLTGQTLEELQDELLEMNLEMARMEKAMNSAKRLSQVKKNTIRLLREQINAKDVYIEQLRKNLDAAQGLYEKQKLMTEEVEELRQQDSIRYTMQIVEQSENLERMQELFLQMQEEYKKEVVRLEKLVLDQSFIITGLLKDGFFGGRPEEPIILDPTNNHKIKARQLKAVYLNFESPKPVKQLPEYRYSVRYIDKKGRNYEVISGGAVNRKSTIKQEIDFVGVGNGHKIQSGRYIVTLSYEENQQTNEMERVFELD